MVGRKVESKKIEAKKLLEGKNCDSCFWNVPQLLCRCIYKSHFVYGENETGHKTLAHSKNFTCGDWKSK